MNRGAAKILGRLCGRAGHRPQFGFVKEKERQLLGKGFGIENQRPAARIIERRVNFLEIIDLRTV